MYEMTPEQLAGLEQGWLDNSHHRLARLYREHLPEITAPMDDPTLLARVAEADRKARALGIKTERGITQYVGFSLANGPDFDEHPKIQHYFQMNGSTPDEKMQLLTDRCADHEAQQARI